MASFRFTRYGREVVEGELIRTDDADANGRSVSVVCRKDLEQLGDDAREKWLERVVLPLVGSNTVLYPEHEVAEKYKARLAQDGLDEQCFKQLADSNALNGAYRELMARPEISFFDLDASSNTVKLEFSLRSGSFATVCLRELMLHDV